MKKYQVLILRDLPPPYGGVRVSSSHTTRLLESQDDINYRAIEFDNQKGATACVLWNYLVELRKSSAVLFQIGDVLTLARKKVLVYLAMAILLRRPIIYRGFGGAVANALQKGSRFSQRIWRLIRNQLTLVTFETKEDAFYFRQDLEESMTRVEWLPNVAGSRRLLSIERREQARKFCFFGRVCKEKGIHLIYQTLDDLPKDISIDVYGELGD